MSQRAGFSPLSKMRHNLTLLFGWLFVFHSSCFWEAACRCCWPTLTCRWLWLRPHFLVAVVCSLPSSCQPTSDLPFFLFLFFFLAHQAVTCRVCDYLNIFFNLLHLCSQHRSPAEPIANFLREIFHFFTIQNHKPSVRLFWLPSWEKRQIKCGGWGVRGVKTAN